MSLILIFIIAFLVVMYLLIFLRKSKKRKTDEINTVEEFHRDYAERMKNSRKQRDITSKTTNYVTKYNSSVDYIEKGEK